MTTEFLKIQKAKRGLGYLPINFQNMLIIFKTEIFSFFLGYAKNNWAFLLLQMSREKASKTEIEENLYLDFVRVILVDFYFFSENRVSSRPWKSWTTLNLIQGLQEHVILQNLNKMVF